MGTEKSRKIPKSAFFSENLKFIPISALLCCVLIINSETGTLASLREIGAKTPAKQQSESGSVLAWQFTLEVNFSLTKSPASAILYSLQRQTAERGNVLKITYKSRKIERICTDAKASDRYYGKEMSEKIQMRIDEIKAADTVEMMVRYNLGRCHALTNNRRGQYAVDLIHPYRLVFEKHGDAVQIAHILEIVDYH